MDRKTQHGLLLLLCLSWLVQCSAAFVFWTSVLESSYTDSSSNKTVDQFCECGVYGRNSMIEKASGIIALPRGDPRGCGLYNIYNRNFTSPPWIALVKRGNCTFSEKIIAAKRQGAVGVIVYNVDGTGNSTTHMTHPEADEIVAVMIGNIKGREFYELVKNGTEVYMIINVGSPHGPWIDTYWLYFLSIAFFVVTAASLAYFVFISANRLLNLRSQRREERRVRSQAKKAIARLQVRTLKRDDVETSSDSHMCAVCIESYRPGEVVTVLTCDHIFHKTCIEPWLLERRTCPMCKCDILKALGVEEEPKEDVSVQPPAEVTVITVTGQEPLYEVPLTGAEHLYDNRAFEEDAHAPRR
ncbi:E3 ubiquitin-protein ligase RNF128-like [Synchiropus splendidus]|uniref:E3 ubiquitin-protein ligase RNF128-like n=1 Tax=Synchiropus splendidus TaxID=270530 RepID=UPI00237D9EB4|nr:E3 ubiquitin-protein ligase RNF128-like [Synchiropus splendidus]